MGRKRKCDCPDECRSPSGRCNVHRVDQGPEYYQTIKEKESERKKRKRKEDPDWFKSQYEKFISKPEIVAERQQRELKRIERRERKQSEKLERIRQNKERGRLRRRKCDCPDEVRDSRGRCLKCKRERHAFKYRSDPEFRKKHLDKWQAYLAIPENKEKRRLSISAYHYAHPEKSREREARRIARVKQAGGDLSSADIKRLRQEAKDSACCEDCGSRDNVHVSHRIPVVMGGPYSSWNIFFLCEKCNLKLGPKTHPSVADIATAYLEKRV